MKKTLTLVLMTAFILLTLTGCTGTTVVVGVDCTCAPSVVTEAPQPTPAVDVQNSVKTGMAFITNVGGSTSALPDKAGEAKYDVTIAAVTLNESGRILSCIVDSVPASVKFDATGAIVTDLNAPIKTKNEQGSAYGMVAYGKAIAEWDQQVAALCKFAVGKTVDELRNGAIDNSGYAPKDSDLASSATIHLGGYIDAIEKAAANAKHLGAKASDEPVLSIEAAIGSSVPASAEKAGSAQLDVTAALITKNSGVITSCYIDALQSKIAFDAAGTITSDLSLPVQTKNELGTKYNMVLYGRAIAEWDVQTASFASYVTGKTLDEVMGISVTESAKPADGTDLSASVTIAIDDFQKLIAKAMQ